MQYNRTESKQHDRRLSSDANGKSRTQDKEESKKKNEKNFDPASNDSNKKNSEQRRRYGYQGY